MAKTTPEERPEITPQVVHLYDVLEWVLKGELRLPSFQRAFVWNRQQMIDLLDSIAQNYPIGTIFLWRPPRPSAGEPPPRSRPMIGPLRLREIEAGEVSLVLDGQQRLTTLVGALLRNEPSWSTDNEHEDPGRWDLYYDAKSEHFLHWSGPEENPPSSCLPVHHLLDAISFGDWAIKAREALSKAEIRGAQRISRALISYRIPVIQFRSNNLQTAVESFARLNRKGRSISQDELFSALTYDGSFHLAGEIDQLQDDMIRDGFGAVDRSVLMRAVLCAADLDMYRSDWTRPRRDERNTNDRLQKERERLPKALKEARAGLSGARRFLKDERILNQRMLPYGMQLVGLSAFFGRCPEPSASQRRLLRRWFWVTSFTAWFGGQNPSRIRDLMQELRDRVALDPEADQLEHIDLEERALPTPERFDLRSARLRALLCLLLRRQPQRRVSGQGLSLAESARILLERGPEATTRIFATSEERTLLASPANRLMDVEPEERGQASAWLRPYLQGDDDPAQRAAFLESHAIPEGALEALLADDRVRFLELRMAYLRELEGEFMREVGVTPSAEKSGPSPIDVDDDPPLGGEDSDRPLDMSD